MEAHLGVGRRAEGPCSVRGGAGNGTLGFLPPTPSDPLPNTVTAAVQEAGPSPVCQRQTSPDC